MDSLVADRTLGIDLLGYNPYTMLADIRADLLIFVGRTAEGVQWFENAIQRVREDHDLLMLGAPFADYGGMNSWVGDAQASLANARQGVEFAEKAAGVVTRAVAYVHLGQAYLHAGSYAEAVTWLERSRTIVRESHAGLVADIAYAPLSVRNS